MSDNALISCVIPVYNGQLFLAEALESVLGQTYAPLEIIVVDDGSTDGTAEVLDRFKNHITVIRQPQSGAPVARNRGVAASTGLLIAFQDADDLWLPEKISRQAQGLADHQEASICTCLWENFWEDDLADEAQRLKNTVHARPSLAAWPGTVVRRELFDQLGAIATKEKFGDAREWLHRARQASVIIEHINEVLVRRRIHSNNLSRARTSVEADLLLRLAERNLARRRTNQSEH